MDVLSTLIADVSMCFADMYKKMKETDMLRKL